MSFVEPSSAAARAGLQPGDRLETVQGRRLRTPEEVAAAVTVPIGDAVLLEVSREGVSRPVRWIREAGL